jgi:hypothetical protein
MKRIVLSISISLIFFILLAPPGHSQSSFDGCKAEGLGKKTKTHPTGKLSQRFIDLNLDKNRDDAPKRSELDGSITLEKILDPRNDAKFENSQGATITGFVPYVVPGEAQESCNCSRKDIRDIHIYVVSDEKYKDDKRHWMIVEISPRWQKKLGKDLKTVRAEIQGEWVTFTGWMFYDAQHTGNAVNTNPRGKALWRATAWEIHPVTSYKVVNRDQ